jgi:hypothetical protein
MTVINQLRYFINCAQIFEKVFKIIINCFILKDNFIFLNLKFIIKNLIYAKFCILIYINELVTIRLINYQFLVLFF